MRNYFCYNLAMVQVTKEQARRFLLTKQLLLPPKSLTGAEGIEQVFETLRLIQYDPLNPCGRNPDLVLQARIKNYHPEAYYTWLYDEKKGIECYDKELCIVSIGDFPFIYHRHFQMQKRREARLFVRKYKTEIEQVLLQIGKTGPLTSQDIKSTTRVESGWGTSATFGRMVLEYLWKIGRVSVIKRENGRKYYGLPGHKYTDISSTGKYSGIGKEHVIRRLRAVGILPKSGSGGGWQGIGSAKSVSQFIEKLLKTRVFLEVGVKGSRRVYVVSQSDAEMLQKRISLESKEVSFIAPLDNLMWDRQMIEDFFDFTYRWEVYTPIKKRQFGYYVLPVLYGDTFVGRIEPVMDKSQTLLIKGLWKERVWDNRVQRAYENSLVDFQKYLRAQKIIYL